MLRTRLQREILYTYREDLERAALGGKVQAYIKPAACYHQSFSPV